MCAKNCCKRTILVQLIVEDVVGCFLNTVYTYLATFMFLFARNIFDNDGRRRSQPNIFCNSAKLLAFGIDALYIHFYSSSRW